MQQITVGLVFLDSNGCNRTPGIHLGVEHPGWRSMASRRLQVKPESYPLLLPENRGLQATFGAADAADKLEQVLLVKSFTLFATAPGQDPQTSSIGDRSWPLASNQFEPHVIFLALDLTFLVRVQGWRYSSSSDRLLAWGLVPVPGSPTGLRNAVSTDSSAEDSTTAPEGTCPLICFW